MEAWDRMLVRDEKIQLLERFLAQDPDPFEPLFGSQQEEEGSRAARSKLLTV